MLEGVLSDIRTKFQVDTFENDVFIAFETSKMATFHDIPMYYQAIRFFVSIRCSMRPSWF